MRKNAFLSLLALLIAVMGISSVGFAEGGAGPRFESKIDIMEIAAAELGMDKAHLKADLQDGKNLYTLLKNAGKLDSFKSRLIEGMKAELDVQVKAGELPKEKADGILAKMKERLDAWNEQGGRIRPAGEAKFCVKLNVIGTAAKELGQSERQLKGELKAGKSIYSLLCDAGKLDSFKATLITGFEEELSKLVSKGELKSDNAERIIRKLKEDLESWSPENDIFAGYSCDGGFKT